MTVRAALDRVYQCWYLEGPCAAPEACTDNGFCMANPPILTPLSIAKERAAVNRENLEAAATDEEKRAWRLRIALDDEVVARLEAGEGE